MTKKKIERKHWILAGITLANAACSLLNRVEAFEQTSNTEVPQSAHVPGVGAPDGFGIEPMLLALGMEMALKAWIVFDKNDSSIIRGHDLAKLFDQLSPQSKSKLEGRFQSEIFPVWFAFTYKNYSLSLLLEKHKKAFEEWRYFYEQDRLHMNTGELKATLKMVLDAFNDRHYAVDRFGRIQSS